jgi:hypothetical protein
MSNDPPTWTDSVTRAQRIDQLCDAFESAWISGQRPSLEGALAQVDPTEHPGTMTTYVP